MVNHHLVPNWANGVDETYQFRTTVFTTRSGKEQRTAERSRARRSISFQGWVKAQDMRDFAMLLETRDASVITIPDGARQAAVLAEDAPAGTSVLRLLPNAPAWLNDLPPIAISEYRQSEFGALESSSAIGAFSNAYDAGFDRVGAARTIRLVTPLKKAWEAGAQIRPVVSGRLPTQVMVEAATNDLFRYSADFSVEPGSLQPVFGEGDLPWHDGLPVLAVKPNWRGPPAIQFVTPFETVDYGRGVAKNFLPVDFFTRISQFDYLGRTHADIGEIYRIFNRAKGRQGEFYCPSWTQDMVPMSALVAGSSYFAVGGIPLDRLQGTVNTRVMILLSDGRTVFRSILTAVKAGIAGEGAMDLGFDNSFDAPHRGDYIRLEFDTPLGINAQRDDIEMVCFLNRCRFATDALTINWATDDVATAAVQIMTLEQLS